MTCYIWRLNVPTDSNKQKTYFILAILKATDEKSRIRIQIRIRNPVFGYNDPHPSQNVRDPEHLSYSIGDAKVWGWLISSCIAPA